MKNVTIPSSSDPFVVMVGNTAYAYKAGTTANVPDEVADVIENIRDMMPKQNPPGNPGQVWTNMGNGHADWATPEKYSLPAAASDAIGGIKKASAVAPATDADDIVTQFNALVASFVASGAIAEYVAPST